MNVPRTIIWVEAVAALVAGIAFAAIGQIGLGMLWIVVAGLIADKNMR